jgi:hypothetical protein
MKNEPLDELYFKFLYAQIGAIKSRNPMRTHWHLAKQLYTTEFLWFIPNDDNRAEDGKYLRHEFLEDIQYDNPDPEWMSLGCSMLEMLVAMSRRLAFMGEGEPREWFWEILENAGIGMASTSDQYYNRVLEKGIDEVLSRIIWRTYSENGIGGLFPLPNSTRDQRKVELWYQMNAYLVNEL